MHCGPVVSGTLVVVALFLGPWGCQSGGQSPAGSDPNDDASDEPGAPPSDDGQGGAGGQNGQPADQGGSGGQEASPDSAPAGGATQPSEVDPVGQAGGGAPPPPTCAYLSCEDFESGLASENWRGGSGVVSKDKAASGEWALKLQIKPNSSGSFMQLKKSLVGHKGPLHGRFRMYLSRAHEWGTSYILRLGNAPTLEFGGKLGSWHVTPMDTREWGKVTFPAGKWVCVAWSVTENPVTMKVSADGATVAEVKVPGSTTVPSYEPLRMGMFLYHPEDVKTAVDFYLDDIVISASPVGCTQ